MEKTVRRKKLGSYPYFGVITSITLALFVTGLFGMLVILSQELERLIRQNVRMEVYLNNGLTDVQRTELGRRLESLSFVSKSDSTTIEFVSKEKAAEKFIAETGEDFRQFLGGNPLHDAYLLRVDPAYHTEARMDSIRTAIQAISGVYEVSYVQGLIENINKNMVRIGLILIGLVILFLLTVVLLINNTIRLALFSQRFLIRSMQLVGATRWFIQKPFLYRSVLLGFVAGLLACSAIWFLSDYAISKITELNILELRQYMLLLFGLIIIIGICVAFFSTFISIRKYLRMSLDELY